MYLVPDQPTLAALLAVYREGGMAAGARALGVSQQSVSVRVAKAEDAWGFAVFERSAQGCKPSPKGQEILVALERLEAATNACAADIARVCDPVLRIAASHTVAEYDLPHWVSGQVRVLLANSHEAQQLVLEGAVDIAFIEGIELVDALSSRTIKADPLSVVVPQDHPWPQRITREELRRVPMVLRERGSGTREVIEQATALAKPAAEFASLATQRRAILALGAPGVLPLRTITPDLRAVEVEGVDLQRDIRAVWRTLSPAAEQLLNRALANPEP
ncbi:LysR family transcriptional regulator [Corynebacterium gerontici]